ncbi:MAG: ABC transporter transmembrane domain-containing protein, partial [Proteobacteria bacterium]|nr:ABC transporter transmembrane domain-containing protein [Pseudomonadota bacterium]
MERGIFSYIIRHSLRQQIMLTVLAFASFPFYYLLLDLPKQIINEGIGGGDGPQVLFGFELEQIPFLLALCFFFLILVFLNGGFKYFINVYRGAVGERMLRRLRYQLIARVLRFPLSHFRKTSSGELVSMISAETEPLGGFIGESFSAWFYQGGMLITLMAFMFVQDWILGLAAVALYPIQGYLIPKLQRRVNQLGKERVLNVRRLTERIGEAVAGASEIHANDTSRYELADFSSRLGKIYSIRFDIYRRKFFIKFLNNFLAQLTPFFFFSIGGVLVIVGDLTLGALVAVLSAYKDVLAPWKILLTHYQRTEDARIKYTQLVEQFEPPNMIDEALQETEPEEIRSLDGRLVASNVSLAEDDGLKVVEGASLSVDLPKHFALIGPGGGGKTEFAQMLARLVSPTGGRITIDDKNLAELPQAVTGRRMAYVSQEPYIFAGSIRDNLLYGLKHRPLTDHDYDGEALTARQSDLKESISSGNSTSDLNAQWIDYLATGAESIDDIAPHLHDLLRIVTLEDDVYQIGLRQTIESDEQDDLSKLVLEARLSLRDRLQDPSFASNVELFDKEKYNSKASVAENILFGTPLGPEFEIENLGENPYVLQVLKNVGIFDKFLAKGHRLA